MSVVDTSRRESIDLEALAISSLARLGGFRVACAESLTSGAIASSLGRAPASSEWFSGGVVAYASDVKVDVLGVTPGPVVTEQCAVEMARGARHVLKADAAVAVTGVGGPESNEGQPPGTVMVAVSSTHGDWVGTHRFTGDPAEVVARTTLHALSRLREVLER